MAWISRLTFAYGLVLGLSFTLASSAVQRQAHAQEATAPVASTDAAKNEQKTPSTAINRRLANFSVDVNQITAELDRLDRAVERTRTQKGKLAPLREAAEAALAQALQLEARILPEQARIDTLIRRLGAVPAEGEPAEAPVLATERKRLSQRRERIADVLGSSRILQERARQLVSLIQSYRRTSFRENLLKRSQSPLSPSVWREVISDSGDRAKQLGFVFQIWWKSIRTDLMLALSLAGLGGLIFLLRHLAARMIERYRDRGYDLHRDFQGRVTSAFFVFMARAIPPIAIAAGIYFAITWFSDMPESFARLASAVLWALVIFSVVNALAWTVLAATNSEWRLLPFSDAAALPLGRVVVAIAGVYSVGTVLNEFVEIIFAPASLKLVLNAATSLALAALLIALVRIRFTWGEAEAEPVSRVYPFWLKIPVLLAALAILIATLTGYIDLALFLSAQVVVTGSILAIAVFCWVAVSEVAKDMFASQILSDDALPGDLSLTEGVRQRGAGILRWLLHVVILAATAVLMLLQWGFDWGDMIVWLRKVFFGFEIGAIRISPAAILVGIGLFVFGVFLTRLLQRSLSNTLLSPNRMDHGLSNSIRTGVGYAGFAASALAAISYAGFNFTNLAIVAGALSVGIGFGLQSIVNNFVSGLILLAERPIQVGDWIVVGQHQGYVRRISVRATVIETFDRASLIIPNSDLMTAAVTNWTYGNRLGRVIVKVGTSYDADPNLVHDTLLEIGRECTLSLTNPPPSVVFEDFADSTLNFSLRVYIADINNIVRAQTEIRMDIWKVFREKDISIDFPQLDVHLKRG